MKEVAECKLANNQEMIERYNVITMSSISNLIYRLTNMKDTKMVTIADLINSTSEEQNKQSQQMLVNILVLCTPFTLTS